MIARLMGLPTIAPADVNELVGRGDITVVDVNSPRSWREAHVPGALNLDATTFAESDLPARKSGLVVFYCSNPMCRKAPNAARRARKMGYTSVRVMSAGIRGWRAAGFPTAAG